MKNLSLRKHRAFAKTTEDYVVETLVWSVMIVFSITVIYPFWKIFVDSISTPLEVYRMGLKIWPREITLDAYSTVFSNNTIGVAYFNTIIRTVAGTAITLMVSFCAAFALSKRSLPGNKVITLLMIFTMFFSGGIIATYLWMKELGLHNNRLALILPPAASAFYIIILRNFFRAIPPDLEESARMDGASVYRILLSIVVPISMPVIATGGLWSIVFHWNSWFDALIYNARPHLLVLQLMLRRILVENQSSTLFELEIDTEATFVGETIVAATLFVSIGPIILIYPFIQKYFVKGIMTGSLKG